MPTVADALRWLQSKNDDGRNWLFRGQSRVWPTIKPSMTRLAPATMRSFNATMRRFYSTAGGVTGIAVENEHDRLAMLQHYIGRSPLIDLTSEPKVALYFALLGAEQGRECVVYAVDSDIRDSMFVFSIHDFSVFDEEPNVESRWLRQFGCSIGPRNWRDLDSITAFDLLEVPGVESLQFTWHPDDLEIIKNLGDLESISGDPLASKIRSVFECIARDCGYLTPELQDVLRGSKTVDSHQMLVNEIDELIVKARQHGGQRDLIDGLIYLRTNTLSNRWDTSFAAELDAYKRLVNNLRPDE